MTTVTWPADQQPPEPDLLYGFGLAQPGIMSAKKDDNLCCNTSGCPDPQDIRCNFKFRFFGMHLHTAKADGILAEGFCESALLPGVDPQEGGWLLLSQVGISNAVDCYTECLSTWKFCSIKGYYGTQPLTVSWPNPQETYVGQFAQWENVGNYQTATWQWARRPRVSGYYVTSNVNAPPIVGTIWQYSNNNLHYIAPTWAYGGVSLWRITTFSPTGNVSFSDTTVALDLTTAMLYKNVGAGWDLSLAPAVGNLNVISVFQVRYGYLDAVFGFASIGILPHTTTTPEQLWNIDTTPLALDATWIAKRADGKAMIEVEWVRNGKNHLTYYGFSDDNIFKPGPAKLIGPNN